MNSSYQQHLSSGLALAEKVSINLGEPQLHVKGGNGRCSNAISDNLVENFDINDLKAQQQVGIILTPSEIVSVLGEGKIVAIEKEGQEQDEGDEGNIAEEITEKQEPEVEAEPEATKSSEDVQTEEQQAIDKAAEEVEERKAAETAPEETPLAQKTVVAEVEQAVDDLKTIENPQSTPVDTGLLAALEKVLKEAAKSTNDNPVTNTPPTLAFGFGAQDILTEGSTGLTLPLFDSVTFNTHQAGQYVDAIGLSITNIGNVGDEYISFDDTLVNLTNGAGLTANGFNYNVLLDGSTAMIMIDGFNAAGQAETLLNNLAYKNSASSYALGDRTFSLETISDSGGPELSQTNLSAIVTLNKPTAGNDFLMGSTGDDTLNGNVGDDTFLINSSNWSPNDVINGGGGRDILSIVSPDTSIDLTTIIAGNITNIEQIDLNAPFASVKLDGLTVKELTNGNGNLFIEGSTGNSVTLEGAAFAQNVSSATHDTYIFSIPVGQFLESYYINVNSDITVDLI